MIYIMTVRSVFPTCWVGSEGEGAGPAGGCEAAPPPGRGEAAGLPGVRGEEETPQCGHPALDITWAPLSPRWRAACAGTSLSSCPAPPGPTAASSD